MQVLDQVFERLTKLALTGNHESGVRHFADDQRRCLDEVPLTLMRHECRNIPDDW